MSVRITHHAAIKLPVLDERSAIELEQSGPVWGLKELLVSAPTKEMLLDILLKIETQLGQSIREVKEMPDEN